MTSGAPASRPPATPEDHPPAKIGRAGVLLINLGTPDATDYWSMRRYLKEFLSDRRVIDVNRLIWWPILNGIILTIRPGKSGKAYDAIWNRERDESPLRTYTRSQAELLAGRLDAGGSGLIVDWAMRYGTPSIPERIAAMKEAGADRILLAPLYPQYSAATTATALDKAYESLQGMRWQPAVRTLPPYFDHAQYVEALARSIESHIGGLDWEPEIVLASYHGLPQRYLALGDPYHCHCQKTTRLLRERLGWGEDRLRITFQSRFGREEWLKPYTADTLVELGRAGVKRIALISPAFAADCVETLEELAIAGRESFIEHGGEQFTVVPCLNDSDDSMALIETLVRNELKGWV